MEINAFEDVIGVIANADTVEGRFVVLTAHTFSIDFGSQTDLPGAKIPATAEEAKRAKYVLTWAVDNRPLPIIQSYPQLSYALRGGFDQAANTPFANTMYTTYPGNQDGLTIPSGVQALAFSNGTFTLPSGSFVYSADIIVPGASLIVANTADDGADAGKVTYTATEAVGVVFETYGYDSDKNELTVKSK